MTVKTILAPLDGSSLSQDMFASARMVVQRTVAHLRVLHIRRDPDDMVPFVFGGLARSSLRNTVLEAARQSANERSERVRSAFEAFCSEFDMTETDQPGGESGTTAEWLEGEDDVLIGQCRASDVVMVPRPVSGHAQAMKTLESVLLESGKPVLMIPPNHLDSYGKHVAVCWNDSRESARTLSTAMSSICQAERVSVLCSKKRIESTRLIIQQLAWHGVDASLRVFEAKDRSAAETMLSELNRIEADLVVMGGYSHTRATQLFFGGVTWHFLNHANVPIWMSH